MTKKTKLWLPLLVAMLMIATVVVAACAKTATVTYVKGADGATGTAPAAQEVTVGDEIELVSNPFEYEGHTFAGWSDGSKTYQVGDKYKVEGNVTFTAMWTEVGGSEEHKCGHVCDVCHKCTDTSCTDPACAGKCKGHDVVGDDHKCDNSCSECGKCLTPNCNHKDCTDKCQGHEQPAEPFVKAPFFGAIGSLTLEGNDIVGMTVLSFNENGGVYAQNTSADGNYYEDSATYTIADGKIVISVGSDKIGEGTIVGNALSVTITLDSDSNGSKEFTYSGNMYKANVSFDGEASVWYIAEGTPLYLLIANSDEGSTIKVNGAELSLEATLTTKMPAAEVTIEVISPEEVTPTDKKYSDFLGDWEGSLVINGATYTKLKIESVGMKIFGEDWVDWDVLDTDATGANLVVLFQKHSNIGRYTGKITFIADDQLKIELDDSSISAEPGYFTLSSGSGEEENPPLPEDADGTYKYPAGMTDLDDAFNNMGYNFNQAVLNGDSLALSVGGTYPEEVDLTWNGNVGTGTFDYGYLRGYKVTVTVTEGQMVVTISGGAGTFTATFIKDNGSNPGGGDEPTTKYTLSYFSGVQSGSGISGQTPDDEEHAAGEVITLPSVSPWTRTGYVFAGWKVQHMVVYPTGYSDWGNIEEYAELAPGAEFTMPSENVRIVARWTEAVVTVTVIYHSNDGSDQTATDSFTYNKGTYTLKASSPFTAPTDKIFAGWAYTTDGENLGEYISRTGSKGYDPHLVSDGDNFILNLYAIWVDAPTIYDIADYAGVWTSGTSTVIISEEGADSYSGTVGSIIVNNQYIVLWAMDGGFVGYTASYDVMFEIVVTDTGIQVAVTDASEVPVTVDYATESKKALSTDLSISDFEGEWERPTNGTNKQKLTITETSAKVGSTIAKAVVIDEYIVITYTSLGSEYQFVLKLGGDSLVGYYTEPQKTPVAVTFTAIVPEVVVEPNYTGDFTVTTDSGKEICITGIEYDSSSNPLVMSLVVTVDGTAKNQKVSLTSMEGYKGTKKALGYYSFELSVGGSSKSFTLAVIDDGSIWICDESTDQEYTNGKFSPIGGEEDDPTPPATTTLVFEGTYGSGTKIVKIEINTQTNEITITTQNMFGSSSERDPFVATFENGAWAVTNDQSVIGEKLWLKISEDGTTLNIYNYATMDPDDLVATFTKA